MKEYLVNVILDDTFAVEAETEDDAIAEAVRSCLSYPGAMTVDATVIGEGREIES